jgi:hypothetical protein
MRHYRSLVLMAFCLTFVVLAGSVLLPTNAHASSKPSLTTTDLAMLRSLATFNPVSINQRITSDAASVNTNNQFNIELSNSGKVKEALRSPNLSPQMREAISQIETNVIGRFSNSKSVQQKISVAAACRAATPAYGYIQGVSTIGIPLWEYWVSQPFNYNGNTVCGHGARSHLATVYGYAIGWGAAGGDTSDTSDIGQAEWVENNAQVFTFAPLHITTIETSTANVDLYMFGGGYYDVSAYID